MICGFMKQKFSLWIVENTAAVHSVMTVCYPGQENLCAAGEGETKLWYPSVWETVDPQARDLKKEIGKIEDQMLSRKRAATPLTPVIPDAHDK